jgi:hypothetical protein
MDISTAVVDRQVNVPISSLEKQTHFQGAAWARDPNTGEDWFFQAQANPVGPGDREDLLIHRFKLVGDKLTFVDTHYGKGYGHAQTFKVRISSASNPYIYIGCEVYNSSNVQTGNAFYKIRFRKGTWALSGDSLATRWYPAPGTAALGVLGSVDWTIVLRRPGSTTETYEWYQENALLAATASAPAKPVRSITVPKDAGVYQSACGVGPYTAPDSIFRFTGASVDKVQPLWQFPVDGTPASALNLVNITNGNTDLEEPESVLVVRGELWVGKQTTPVDRRILGYSVLDLGGAA